MPLFDEKAIRGKFLFPKNKNIVIVTKDSANYFLSRISVSMFTNTNTFVLGLVLGNTIVGYYSLADKVYQALTGIYQPLVAAIFPYMTKNKRITLFKKIFIWSNLANICLVVIVALGISDIMHLLFRNVDESSVKVMHIFLFACLVALPNTLLGYPFFGSIGTPQFHKLFISWSFIDAHRNNSLFMDLRMDIYL